MPFLNKKTVLFLIFIVVSSLAIILGSLLYRHFYQAKKDLPKEEKLVLRSAGDITREIERLKPKFTDPNDVSYQLTQLVDEAKYYQASSSALPHTREWVKQSKYYNVFTQLKGQYYATFDPQILELIKALEEFYKERYPGYYKAEEWKI